MFFGKHQNKKINIILISILILLFFFDHSFYKLAILNWARLYLNKSYLETKFIHYDSLAAAQKFLLFLERSGRPNQDTNVEFGRVQLLKCDFVSAYQLWNQSKPFSEQQSMFLNSWVVNYIPIFCDAESTYRFALSLWPEYPHAYLRLGSMYYDKKQFEKTIDILKKGTKIKLAPTFPYIYTQSCYLIARSYHALHDLPQAEFYYQKTIESDPHNRWMWYTNSSYIYLGDLALKRGDFEQSAKYYLGSYSVAINDSQRQQAKLRIEKLLEKAPDNAIIRDLVGSTINE